MPTQNIIQWQNEIIQRFHTIINDYERGKSKVEARLNQDKETAESTWNRDKGATEAAWRRDKEAAEQNWSRTKAQADALVESVRKAVKSAQDVLERTRWQNKLVGGTPRSLIIPSRSSFIEQMAMYQSASKQINKEINGLLIGHNSSIITFIIVALGAGFIIAALLVTLSFMALFPGFSPTSSVFVLAYLLVFILTYGLIYTVLYALYTQRMLHKLKDPYATLLGAVSNVEDLYKHVLDRQEKSQRQLDESQTRYRTSIEQIDQTYQGQLVESQARYDEAVKQLEQTWQRGGSELRRDIETFIHEAGLSGASLSESLWKQWQPVATTSSLTRLGSVTLKLRQEQLPPLPLFVSCPGGENILFKAAGPAKNTAIAAIQSFMLRLLATQPPGQIRFTFIDPVGLGHNVAPFMQLADYDEALVTTRAWIQPGQIEQQLVDLTEHMGEVIRRYLRGQYQTLADYKRAGGVAEPYRILVVMDFPVNFTVVTARQLVNIAANGPRCGVSVIVMVDTQQPVPAGFNLADLERVTTVIAWDGQRFTWRGQEQAVFTQ